MQASRPVLQVFKRTGGLVWKNWPMNHTRRANAKERHRRLQKVDAVLKACAGPPPSSSAAVATASPKAAKAAKPSVAAASS
eukprot:SM000372S13689  [mRNA]  locus=s372:77302:77995:- [translate_table: standard]